MKKIIIHSVPVVISFIWLVTQCQTFNLVTLKGPEFLKFYLILVLGFYTSIVILKSVKESISSSTFYFMIMIFGLGIVKLIRGILLGKPIGFLIMILLMESIIGVYLMSWCYKDKLK